MAITGKRDLLILRRRQELKSQHVVAAEIGVSQATYSNIENGYTNPSNANAKRLIKMFDLSDDYFGDLQKEAQ